MLNRSMGLAHSAEAKLGARTNKLALSLLLQMSGHFVSPARSAGLSGCMAPT